MIGETISHYKILEKLGEGGMGVVYKALDTTLDRHVAIKFLPPHLSKDEEATKRFIHEAKAASALDQVNIGTIHEVDKTSDGRTFIVMAHYEGETLRERIDRGNIAVDEALNITSQIASGLARAHETEIVHRDIKPSNIIITKHGEAKIIDFGLAKLAGKTRLTKEGITLGTVAYMSPEQAKGKEADHRSDIFSLGSIFYEMLAGEPPFMGEHEAALLYEIVHEEPETLIRYRSDIPQGFQNIVDKTLNKNASDRYQSATAMLEDLKLLQAGIAPIGSVSAIKRSILRRNLTIAAISILVLIIGYFVVSRYISIGPGKVEPKRIMMAVLPFENLGPPKDEYFADGITEEITARLARIQELGVIARTSAIQYKNTDKSIHQIGKELGVEYIMEGTIRWQSTSQDPSRIRVTPQLIKVSDATHLWADIYEEPMTEVFNVQSDIAMRVVEAMGIALLERERGILESKPTDNLDAYQAYLRGLDYVGRIAHSKENLQMAVQLFERAVELDPGFAVAHAELSMAHLLYYHRYHDRYYPDRTTERLVKARAAVDRALKLQPELLEAQLAQGFYYYRGSLEYDKALEEFTIAEKNAPNDSRVIEAIGAIHKRQGRFEKALGYYKRANELNPQDASIPLEIGIVYQLQRRFSEAEYYFDRAITIAPNDRLGYLIKLELYLEAMGDLPKARKTLETAPSASDSESWLRGWWWLELLERNYQAALDRAKAIPDREVNSYCTGLVYLSMGDRERANAAFDSTRAGLEKKLAELPESPRIHRDLGLVYAHLGRKDEAIRYGKYAVDMVPISKHPLDGLDYVKKLARVYMIVGEPSAAMDLIEYLLSIPSFTTVADLRLNPEWDPLRDHPRFQKLIEGED